MIQTSTLAERAAHQHTLTTLGMTYKHTTQTQHSTTNRSLDAPLAVVGLLGPSDPQVASQALALLLLMVDDGTDYINPKPNQETKVCWGSGFQLFLGLVF